MCIKSDFEEIILKLASYGQRKGLSVIIKFLFPVGCLPQLGAIYMWKTNIKNGKKLDFKEFF